MMVHSGTSNHLLTALSPAVRARLTPHLRAVTLKTGASLFRAHETLGAVYFPETCVIALVTSLTSGETLEVGLVGRDGVSAISVFPDVSAMPCDAVVEIGGTAQRIDAETLRREVGRNEALHALIGRYAQLVLAECMHLAGCISFHPVQERCARQLLRTADLVERDEFPLTQARLAGMLGARRASVTVVVGALERAGLIEHRRGRMRILDRRRLEAASCECYEAMRMERRRLLADRKDGRP
jgi:CRP-like cAMP-binding protein